MEDEVALRFYRPEPLKGPTEVGTRPADDKEIRLSKLVDKLNDRFGTDFKQADQLFFDQVAEAAVENETLKTAAQVNTIGNFKHVFDRMLEASSSTAWKAMRRFLIAS